MASYDFVCECGHEADDHDHYGACRECECIFYRADTAAIPKQ